jgi:hypothetical protein
MVAPSLGAIVARGVSLRRLSLPTMLAFAVLAGCSIDDRKLTEHDGLGDDSGGRGGNAGTDSGGSSGSSGRGGTSATGGAAGRGGSSGTSGSGGFDAARDCDGDPIDIDADVVRGCLMQVGCNPFVPSTSLSFCISNQRLRTFSQDDCGSGAMNCDDYLECRGQGYYDGADCTSGEPVYCESETLGVACARYPYAIDCGKFGGTCATYTDDGGDERVWCSFPELGTCTDPAGAYQCSTDDIAYTCVGGTAYGNDCQLLGSTCRDGTCYYVLPGCSEPGATCGTATRLDLCFEDTSDVARYECAQGLGCKETSTSAGCVAPGCAINEACTESCSGTELTFCYGGSPVTLDCTDYGFRRCLESTPANGNVAFAYCAFPETAVDRACEVEDTDNACGTCAKTECCAAWTACIDNPECVGYINCASDCAGASACIEACDEMYPLGTASYDAFFSCRDDACSC